MVPKAPQAPHLPMGCGTRAPQAVHSNTGEVLAMDRLYHQDGPALPQAHQPPGRQQFYEKGKIGIDDC
jgi:hypothetical protein